MTDALFGPGGDGLVVDERRCWHDPETGVEDEAEAEIEMTEKVGSVRGEDALAVDRGAVEMEVHRSVLSETRARGLGLGPAAGSDRRSGEQEREEGEEEALLRIGHAQR